jgi:glycosidase
MPKWHNHIERASEMNFDWVYINPINAPGFSGSDYALRDYYQYHPMFIKGWPLEGEDYSQESLEKGRVTGDKLLKEVCDAANAKGMNMMMDLVINHTAIDSPLTQEKPEWYKRDEAGNILNPGADDNGTWVTWGDLAQIDNLNSPDRDNLWKYWLDMVLHYCELGIRGFRCDAAYHVPEELWKYLISNVKKKYSDVIFLGETLGCTPAELQVVAFAGFDIVMNSFKWWNYKDEWFLKDYREWAGKYPSLTFPENHDTERYAAEAEGNREKAIATYTLQSYFCSSIAITLGFEYGFERKIDVVQTNPTWYEDGRYDITSEIKELNRLKKEYEVLHQDNIIIPYNFHNDNIFAFTKESLDKSEKIFVVANLSEHDWQHVYIDNLYGVMESGKVEDLSLGHKMEFIPQNLDYNLKPLEVKLFYVKK